MATKRTTAPRRRKDGKLVNPQDTTLRNVRAAKKRYDELQEHVKELAGRLVTLVGLLDQMAKRMDAVEASTRANDDRMTELQEQLTRFAGRFAKLLGTTAAP